MTFHPDSNLPGCMMPDGGDCCAGHAAVCADWHRQRRELDMAKSVLRDVAQFMDAVKPDAEREGWWSEWDQQVRSRITTALSSHPRNHEAT